MNRQKSREYDTFFPKWRKVFPNGRKGDKSKRVLALKKIIFFLKTLDKSSIWSWLTHTYAFVKSIFS